MHGGYTVRNELLQITDAGRSEVGEFRNDCVIRACALLTGRPYLEIHNAFKALGRRTNCGTKFNLIAEVIRRPLQDLRKQKPTLAYFLATHPTGTYGVAIAGHMFVVKDGKILDLFLPGMRCRVKYIWTM